MDERAASALEHWSARFTANGVTPSDLARITAHVRRWEDWCAVWSEVGAEHEALGRHALSTGRFISAGEHLVQAALCFHFAKFVFVQDIDQMRRAHANALACLADALPHLRFPGRRVEIPFEGSTLAAILRCPPDPGPHPVVLLLPGLDSTKEELHVTENTFLERGLATFSLDGPGQGEAEYHLPIRSDWSGPAEAVLDTLRRLPEVDEHRLGVWGVCLGGYYSACVAGVLGHRVKGCVSLSGPYDFGACWDGLPELARRTFEVRSWAGSERRARRLAETLNLDRFAAGITAPLLIVFGGNDRLIPWQQAERLQEAAGGKVETLMLSGGNHACANAVPWHRPYTADWLAAALVRESQPA